MVILYSQLSSYYKLFVVVRIKYVIVLFIVNILMAGNRPKSLEAIRTSEESKNVDMYISLKLGNYIAENVATSIIL